MGDSSQTTAGFRSFGWRGPLAIVATCAVIVVTMGTWFLYNLAHTGSCEVAHHRELSIDELIAVKKRFKEYRRTPEAGLELTGEELGMLIEERSAQPMFVDVQGDRFHAQLALDPEAGRCWPVAFAGGFRIEDGKAFIVPDNLTVGEVDLSSLVSGTQIEILPEYMPNSRAADLVQRTRSATVIDGGLFLHLQDPDLNPFSKEPPVMTAD